MISKTIRTALMSITVGLALGAPASADPPKVNSRIPDQTAPEGEQFRFTVPSNTFRDPDGRADALEITIRKIDDVRWLRVDESTETLSGTPGQRAIPPQRVRVRVTAKDRDNQIVEDQFRVIVEPMKPKDTASLSNTTANRARGIIPASSATGRLVAQVFEDPSGSESIVEGIGIKDLATGKFWTVDVGGKPQSFSNPSLSADGRIVAFFAQTEKGEGVRIVLVDEPMRVRTIPAKPGSTRKSPSEAVVSLAADGRAVAFEEATGIVVAEVKQGDEADTARQLVIDNARSPSLSRDGSRVAYEGIRDDVLVATLDLDGMRVLDTTAIGLGSNPVVSADGSLVAFESAADDLVAGDSNGARDIFVYDWPSRTISRASVDGDGDQDDHDFFNPSLSEDGSLVAFDSFVSLDGPGAGQIFVRQLDRRGAPQGKVRMVSVDSAGNPGDRGSTQPALSADGNLVAFASAATNLTVEANPGYAVLSLPTFPENPLVMDFPMPDDIGALREPAPVSE